VSDATGPVHLKVDLGMRGVRLDPSARDFAPGFDAPLPMLDLLLPDDVRVCVPIATEDAPLLVAEGKRLFVVPRNGGERVEVRSTALPRFASRQTVRGVPMRRVATVLGDHLLVHPGAVCGFSVHGAPCRFCLEGARGPTERATMPTVADVIEVVRAAFEEGVASLVYVNGSPFEAEDGGMSFLAPYVEAIRKHFDTLVAVQVHPPKALSWIDRTYAMGVDAISFNLEIFDPELLNRHCIGRARYIGRERYLEALARAAEVFPSGTVWSDLVVGIEPVESTIEGIDTLTAMGVLPIVGMRRPVTADAATVGPADVAPVLAHLHRAVRAEGISMGWLGDLTLGITPLEAREFTGDDARMALAMRQLTRWRLGALAARGLARVRRRLRVHEESDGIDVEH
jgi:hypothetical protein